MRVLIINTSERMGGAAIAANRLMESLNGAGIDTGIDNTLCSLLIIAILRIPHHSLKEDIRNTDSY